jgi:Mn2+/Fe2+ NRAMP family transporter
MGTIVTLTVGLIIWIVLWANGIKAFDAFLIPFFMVMIAVTLRMVMPYVRERLLP